MDAPIYSPAKAYTVPRSAPFKFRCDMVSLAELMTAPVAWAIVLKHAPVFKGMVSSPLLKPYLTNMTVDSFITYGAVKADAVDAIDAEFSQLPAADRPAL